MQSFKNPILLTPGPVPLSSSVKAQLGRDMTHHRSKEISKALVQIQSHLQKIFQTQEPVYILNSTGTGAMEASLTNTLSPGDSILAVCAGKFGDRWKEMAQAHQLISYDIQVPWGKPVTAKAVQEKLEKHPEIRAVLIQACETSTTVVHPIQEISQLTRNKENTLLIVDAISAFLTMDLPMDQWGMDVLIGGAQKSFGLPAGLSFIALSKKAQKFQKTSRIPAYYFDLEKEKKANAKGQTAFSGNVSFLRALKASLDEFQKIGFSNIQKKSQSLAKAAQDFCKDLGLPLFSSSLSSSVTGVCMPQGVDGSLIKKIMEERNVIVGGGQDHLKGRIIRFGHLGAIQTKDYIQGLRVFGEVLREKKPELFSEQQLQSALLKVETFLNSKNIDF